MPVGMFRVVIVLLACSPHEPQILAAQPELLSPATADSEASSASSKHVPSSKDDLDKLMNMGFDELGKAKVSALVPAVDGVSKKVETLTESPGIVDVIAARDIEPFGVKNHHDVLERATSLLTGDFMFRRNVASIRGNNRVEFE